MSFLSNRGKGAQEGQEGQEGQAVLNKNPRKSTGKSGKVLASQKSPVRRVSPYPKSEGVRINLISECKYFYKEEPPDEIEKVVFKVETYGLTNKMDFTSNESNTKKNRWGSYILYGDDLTMTQEEIQQIRQKFKNQAIIDRLVYDFYYPLRCIRNWWNETFRLTNSSSILRPITIEDIIIPDNEIEKFENEIEKFENDNYDFKNFDFYVNINGVSEEGLSIPVTIKVKIINNTGGLNVDSLSSSGGYKKRRKISKRRRVSKRRKLSKRRRVSKRRNNITF